MPFVTGINNYTWATPTSSTTGTYNSWWDQTTSITTNDSYDSVRLQGALYYDTERNVVRCGKPADKRTILEQRFAAAQERHQSMWPTADEIAKEVKRIRADLLAYQALERRVHSSIAAPGVVRHESRDEYETRLRREEAERRQLEAERAHREIEQRLARQHREQERQIAEAADRERREQAEQVARGLLLEHLNETQRATYLKNGWFIVQGGKSGRRYVIRDNDRSRAGNVDVLAMSEDAWPPNPYEVCKDDFVVERMCCHISLPLPHCDHLLAQKVTLEFDEDAFVRTANKGPVAGQSQRPGYIAAALAA